MKGKYTGETFRRNGQTMMVGSIVRGKGLMATYKVFVMDDSGKLFDPFSDPLDMHFTAVRAAIKAAKREAAGKVRDE